MPGNGPFDGIESVEDACSLAKAIVDTIREPLLVLDQDLRVVTASRSYFRTFKLNAADIRGILLYDLGDGQWDIPELRLRLTRIVPDQAVMEGYEVERDFAGIGHRNMVLNARKVFYETGSHANLLLAFEDVTERRATDRRLQELLAQKDTLLLEMSHRIANSLQLIASILLMKAKTVHSEETRRHLEDAHRRVMSVASVQQYLNGSGNGEKIEVGPYLSKLCESLAGSMIGDVRPISLNVVAGDGTADSAEAVCLGLVVTELVINALKHAFHGESEGHVIVGYEADGPNWKLSVSDNGRGMPSEKKPGLGTSLIAALAGQLEAKLETATGSTGTTVSITHATFTSRLPTVA